MYIHTQNHQSKNINPQNIWHEPIFLLFSLHRKVCRHWGIRHFHSPQWFFQSAGWWSDDLTERAESLTQKVLQGTRTGEERHVVSEGGGKESMGRNTGVDGKPRDENKEFNPFPFISEEIKERKEKKKTLSCGIRWAADTWVVLLSLHSNVAILTHNRCGCTWMVTTV